MEFNLLDSGENNERNSVGLVEVPDPFAVQGDIFLLNKTI